MKILVTGASGFVGGAIATELAAANHQIIGVVNRRQSLRPIQNVELIQADLSREWAFAGPVDCVIHASAVLPHDRYDASELISGNEAMMTELVRWSAREGAQRIINLSSLAVYGQNSAAPILSADTPVEPDTPYAKGKMAAELILTEATRSTPASGITLRLPAVVGTGSHHNFPSNSLANVVNGKPLSITNPNSLYNHIVHVRELCRFVTQLLKSGFPAHACCVLGSSEPITIRRFVEAMLEYTGQEVPISESLSERSCPIVDYQSAARLGFTATSVLDTLKRFIAGSNMRAQGD